MGKEKLIYSSKFDNEFEYEEFVEILNTELNKTKIKNKVCLVAENFNWLGNTGTSICKKEASEILSKCLLFGNDSLELYKSGKRLFFKTASHDVPMGFNIYIYPESKKRDY